MRDLEQLATWAGVDEPVDVKRTEQENESVDRTEDRKRDRRFTCRQERRHGIRGSQDSIDHPGLTTDFSGEPAGNDRNEGQRKAEERHPKQRTNVPQTMLKTQITTDPGQRQHNQAASDHNPEAEERDDHRWPVLR